jgi:hypothetical protein
MKELQATAEALRPYKGVSDSIEGVKTESYWIRVH